jgi:hypothetical protein
MVDGVFIFLVQFDISWFVELSNNSYLKSVIRLRVKILNSDSIDAGDLVSVVVDTVSRIMKNISRNSVAIIDSRDSLDELSFSDNLVIVHLAVSRSPRASLVPNIEVRSILFSLDIKMDVDRSNLVIKLRIGVSTIS